MKKNLKAGKLSSLQTPKENDIAMMEWEQGSLNFLLAAPERFKNERFLEAINKTRPDMVVVDEAHTLSQWSDNFRHDYVKIGDIVAKYNPKIVLCLTATCPEEVETDIRRVIKIPQANKIVYLPPRENLIMKSKPWVNEYELLSTINKINGPTVVFCATVREVEHLYKFIGGKVKGKALTYHGQMKPADKDSNQDLFMQNQVRVMFATNSFGMGVDKPDIRAIIHRDIPGSLENYTQEAGRAGRDDIESQCILYYDKRSVETQNWFLDMAHPGKRNIIAFFNAIKKLADPNQLCHATLSDICKEACLQNFVASAIIQILSGSKVVERQQGEPMAKVKFKKEHVDDKYQYYFDVMDRIGIPTDNDYIEIDIKIVAAELGLTPATIKRNLKLLDDNGYMEYIPPPKSKPLKIIGDLSLVNFERLDARARDARNKLATMENYYYHPDNTKHEFAFQYFMKGTNNK